MAKKSIEIDEADYPMKGNKLSPKEQYKSIMRDVNYLAGEIPDESYTRPFMVGTSEQARRRQVAKDLMQDSDVGRFAAPGYGDLGQFFKKGGKVTASKRADGIAKRGKTRGKIV